MILWHVVSYIDGTRIRFELYKTKTSAIKNAYKRITRDCYDRALVLTENTEVSIPGIRIKEYLDLRRDEKYEI